MPLEAVSAALRLYKTAVEPFLEPDRSDPQAKWRATLDDEELSFFCLSPSAKKWKYHIDWVYPDDLATRQSMQALFDALEVKKWFTRGAEGQMAGMEIDTEVEVAMYAASFVVRTGAKDEPFWHTDYEWFFGHEGEAIYTYITIYICNNIYDDDLNIDSHYTGRTTPRGRPRVSRPTP